MAVSNGQLANQTTFNTYLVSRTIAQSIAGAKTFNDNIISNAALRLSTENNITAFAGGGQGSAYALTKDINFVTVSASAGDSVKLPLGEVGRAVIVFNFGVNTTNIFPFLADQIDSLGVNAAYPLASGEMAWFYCSAANQWWAKSATELADFNAHVADTTTHGTTGNIVGTTDSQTLTNKTITAPTIDLVNFDDQVTPSNPAAGFYKLYFKNDGVLYSLNSAGVETPIGTSTSGKQESLGTGDGVTTTFGPLSFTPIDAESVFVSVDSIQVPESAWSLTGNSIVFTAGNIPAVDQQVYVFYLIGSAGGGGGGGSTWQVEYHTVTVGEAAAKSFSFSSTPGSPTEVLVDIIGGTSQQYSVDFTVSGSSFNWTGLGLDGVLLSGDVVRLAYFT